MTIAEFINKVGFKVNDKDVDKVNGTINNIKSTATKVLGAIGIGFSLTQINELVESLVVLTTKSKTLLLVSETREKYRKRFLNLLLKQEHPTTIQQRLFLIS